MKMHQRKSIKYFKPYRETIKITYNLTVVLTLHCL